MIMRFENLKHHEKVKWFECEIPSFSTKRLAIGCKLGLKSMHIKRQEHTYCKEKACILPSWSV